MAAGSSSKLASLGQPSLQQRSGLTWIQSIAQPGRTILGPCHYNFNSGVYVIGNTMLFSKTSKTTTAWWLALAPNSRKLPLTLKYQIKNRKNGACQRQHQPDGYLFNSGLRVIGKTRAAPKTSKTTTAGIGKTRLSPKRRKPTTAWWLALASNSRKLPLAMNTQIKNRKSGAWLLLTTMQLHCFPLHNLYLGPF